METLHRAILVFLFAARASAGAAVIEHEPVDCMVAGEFPRVDARVSEPGGIARARVRFRPESGRHWYSVALNAQQDGIAQAVLPRPTAALKQLRYYIEVTDVALATARTPEYLVEVASGPGACQDRKIATAVSSATVSLEAPAGAPSIPAGFSAQGVSMASSVASSTAAGATVGAVAGSGGHGAGLLIAGGVAALGAGVAVAAAAGGTEEAAAGLTGRWTGNDVFSGPAGACGTLEFQYDWSLVQSGQGVTGTFTNTVARATDTTCVGQSNGGSIQGTISGTSFTFEQVYPQGFRFPYAATVEGATMSGTRTLAGGVTTTFRLTRQ